MKTSFCSIAFRKSSKKITDIVPIIADLGYDAIEIWGNHFGDLPLNDVVGCLNDNSLAVSMISPYMDFTAGSEGCRRSLETADKFLAIANALDAPNIRVFTGVVGSADATAEQWSDTVAGLKQLSRSAAGSGITFSLETHPQTLVDTVESTTRLLEAVGADNVRINLDIFHLWEVHRKPLWVLDRLRPFVSHIHAKNADLPPAVDSHHPLLHDKQGLQDIVGVTYLKDGKMPYPEFLSALKHGGYEGYVSIEWFGDNIIDAARHELGYLRDVVGKGIGKGKEVTSTVMELIQDRSQG